MSCYGHGCRGHNRLGDFKSRSRGGGRWARPAAVAAAGPGAGPQAQACPALGGPRPGPVCPMHSLCATGTSTVQPPASEWPGAGGPPAGPSGRHQPPVAVCGPRRHRDCQSLTDSDGDDWHGPGAGPLAPRPRRPPWPGWGHSGGHRPGPGVAGAGAGMSDSLNISESPRVTVPAG